MIEVDETNRVETQQVEAKDVEDQLTGDEKLKRSDAPIEPEVDDRTSGSRANPWLLLVAGLLVGGLAGFYLHPLLMPTAAPDTRPLAGVESSDQINRPEPHRAVMMAVIAGARHFYGDPNAPITLVEFGDFNCGYCGKWAHEVLPQIDEKYIQTGKVRMAYVHFPILGADSMTAAEASECAGQQDKFWEYHNILFAHQGIGFSPENLTLLAEQTNLDTNLFEECLTTFSDRESLDGDISLSQVMGVRGTPAFLVNGIPLAGAYPYEEFERIIEETLAGEF